MKNYPAHWWSDPTDPEKPSWEILPSAARPGEVILSKRNELGLLSNLAATPFTLDGERFASVESLWQMMKFPENEFDPRAAHAWPARRRDLQNLSGFEAKDLGDAASAIMKAHGIQWVTYKGERWEYPEREPGPFHRLIERAMVAKAEQNPKVRQVLVATDGLTLRPDHDPPEHAGPSHRYHEMWMVLREHFILSRETSENP